MGQQQLLLLVLGIVIVGLAVVVGIQAFSENQISANADAMVNDGVRIASDIQAWALKPSQFGGMGDGSLSDAEFNDLGYEADDEYVNVNGTYTIESSVPGECEISEHDDVIIKGENTQTGNIVCVGLGGTQPDDIETDVVIGGSS